jgi:hypothetical protein
VRSPFLSAHQLISEYVSGGGQPPGAKPPRDASIQIPAGKRPDINSNPTMKKIEALNNLDTTDPADDPPVGQNKVSLQFDCFFAFDIQTLLQVNPSHATSAPRVHKFFQFQSKPEPNQHIRR